MNTEMELQDLAGVIGISVRTLYRALRKADVRIDYKVSHRGKRKSVVTVNDVVISHIKEALCKRSFRPKRLDNLVGLFYIVKDGLTLREFKIAVNDVVSITETSCFNGLFTYTMITWDNTVYEVTTKEKLK